jgi:hypothetical protein
VLSALRRCTAPLFTCSSSLHREAMATSLPPDENPSLMVGMHCLACTIRPPQAKETFVEACDRWAVTARALLTVLAVRLVSEGASLRLLVARCVYCVFV